MNQITEDRLAVLEGKFDKLEIYLEFNTKALQMLKEALLALTAVVDRMNKE